MVLSEGAQMSLLRGFKLRHFRLRGSKFLFLRGCFVTSEGSILHEKAYFRGWMASEGSKTVHLMG